MTVQGQIHSRFKLFSGSLGAGGSLGKLATEVADFAKKAKAAPKSIGIEYLEHSKEVVFSLGYRDDQPAYDIKIDSLSLGKVATLDAAELSRVEKKMEEAAAKVKGLICHELVVTDQNEFILVFMTHVG
jgi:hypothetical protein